MDILLVEDEPQLAGQVSRALVRAGHSVATAGDGPGALETLTARRFDLVLLDVNLPGFDGFEVLARIRQAGLPLRVLMLTARSEVGDRVAGLKAGADDYLTKPFALEELLARVDVLGRRNGSAPETRDPARSDVVLLVEASSDLATWLPLAASVNGSPFDGPGYQSGENPGAAVKSIVVRDLQPVTAAPRRFLRLRVLSGFNPATPLESWKMARLGDPAAPDDGDPDRDGQPNLLEYALGRLPTVPDAAPLPSSLAGGFLTLTVPRDPARNDLTLTVEATGNLAGPWTALATSTLGSAFSGPGYLSGESPDTGVKTVLVRDLVAVTAAPRRFIRLRATR